MTNRTLEEARNIIQSSANSKCVPKHIGRLVELKVERNPSGMSYKFQNNCFNLIIEHFATLINTNLIF